MNPNLKPSDQMTLLDVIDPVSTSSTAATAWLSMATVGAMMATVMVGAMGTGATLDAKLQQATDTNGTSAKDITGKAITQLTEAGTDANKQAIINLYSEELDVNNGFDCVRLLMTAATATCQIGALVQGCCGRYLPLTDATSVDEIVG